MDQRVFDRDGIEPAMMHRAAALFALMAGVGCASGAGIMSWSAYGRLTHPVPYILKAESKHGGSLLYFGTEHMGARRGRASHPEIAEMEVQWRQFKPTLAFYEGTARPRIGPTLEESAATLGEPGALAFLAAHWDVAFRSLEPADSEVDAALRDRFSVEQIKLFYVLGCIAQNCVDDGKGTPEQQAERLLERLGRRPALAGPPSTVADIDRSAKALLPQLPDWRRVTKEFLDPVPRGPETFLNELSRRTGDIRDQHMVELLVSSIRAGHRVFAVVGASHVVMQEPALRSRLRGMHFSVSHR